MRRPDDATGDWPRPATKEQRTIHVRYHENSGARTVRGPLAGIVDNGVPEVQLGPSQPDNASLDGNDGAWGQAGEEDWQSAGVDPGVVREDTSTVVTPPSWPAASANTISALVEVPPNRNGMTVEELDLLAVQYMNGMITEAEVEHQIRDRLKEIQDAENSPEKKSAEEWLKLEAYQSIVVLDPDGWDRANFVKSWHEPITELEFNRRLNESTIQVQKARRGKPIDDSDVASDFDQ